MRPTINNKVLGTTTLSKSKTNLSVVTMQVETGQVCDFIKSYDTYVAYICHDLNTIYTLGYWSMTTSKHINIVANEYGYKVVKGVSDDK